MEKLVSAHCEERAALYADNPMATGATTAILIDLYQTIARLARVVGRQQEELDRLRGQ